MTDKELKKLSRLELLELLLAESRENERLREELEKIKKENTIEKSAQQLTETSKQMDETSEKLGTALEQISLLIKGLSNKTIVSSEERNLLSDDETQEFQHVDSESVEEEKETDFSEGNETNDISKRLNEAMQLISSRIKELDRIADIVSVDKLVSDYEEEKQETEDSQNG